MGTKFWQSSVPTVRSLSNRTDDTTARTISKVATSFVEPMGLDGATALDITILPAMELLQIGKETGEQRFLDAGKKAIDFCMSMTRPEGGDFWETPLHAANLFAAGHAAIANYKAFEQFGDPKYKEKAVYWMRTILPFTHLWEPEEIPMLYNTKPVLSSSDWYFANWVRDHVQWEVLAVFAQSIANGIRWEEVDPEIDWMKFHRGITNAAIRWMNVHTDDNWRSAQYSGDVRPLQRGCVRLLFPRYAQCDDGQLRRYVYSSFRYRGQHLLPVGPRSRGGKR